MDSDSPDKTAPRRSARERKQPSAIAVQEDRPKKRKRTAATDKTDDEGAATADDEPAPTDNDDDVDEPDADEDSDPESKPKPKRASKKTAQPRKAAGTAKPRAAAGRKGKKGAAAGDDAPAAFDHAQVAKETRIPDDNALFNTILNPAAALQSTAEDFLDSYGQTPQLALSELVTCFIRSCGCSASVDQDDVVDSDGVVSKLDDFAEALLKETAPTYPLASKLAVFKKFRKSLGEFLHRLVAAAFDLDILIGNELFIPTIQSWVFAMSSSQLRSFRHTAAVISLEIETALCEVAAATEKEAETLVRQRDAEKKKKGRSAAREKELETKAKQANSRRTKLKGFLKDFFEGVFVHRFRDHHAEIRAECMHALGAWLKIFPAHFLAGEYLRYVGWLLSDADSHVRLEAVKSLVALYSKEDYIVTLRNFTERFKGRLLEMATSDLEISIRVASIQVLSIIDSHSLLEDEQRESLCLLVFDQEARIRKAISAFVKGVWSEDVENRLSGRSKATQKDTQRAGIKALAVLLVQWTRVLEKLQNPAAQDADETTEQDVALLVSPTQKGRVAFAVEGLWDEIKAVPDWEGLLEHLLLDHSAHDEAGTSVTPSRRKKATKASDEAVDDAWRLEEDEESFILEVAVASLAKNVADAKKSEGDTAQADITRTLMTALPRLFAKYQADDKRICNVLLIPQHMALDLFLEMRVISSYEALWDDVNKQFLSNPNPVVMNHAMDTIHHLMSATSLSNANSTKILELEDELSSSLRDVVAGRDELEIVTFTDDDIQRLSAIAMRIGILFGRRDMSSWMEEDEGGKQSSAWDIIIAIVDRGALGYKAEEQLVDHCVHVLATHIMWKARVLLGEKSPSPEDDPVREALQQQRDTLLEKLTEFAVGQRSKPCERVARAAFQKLISLHVLFRPPPPDSDGATAPSSVLHLTMDEQTQYRCAGFVQAEIERYADEVHPDGEAQNGDNTEGSAAGSGSETEGPSKAKEKVAKKSARREGTPDPSKIPQSRLEREYATSQTLTMFLAGISAGAIDLKHAPVLLANYDRLEHSFDASTKRIVDILREEGVNKNRGDVVASVVSSALKEAFNLYLDDVVQTESHAIALAKVLSTAFFVRGQQLTVTRRMDSQHVVAVHTNGISWIVKQIATHESNKNARMKRKALMFFKVLALLLSSIENRDAMKIKAHLDQTLAQAKLDIGSLKEWDPIRAYEKRLSSKDKSIVPTAKAKRARAKKADGATSEEDGLTDGERPNGVNGADVEKPKKPARARAPRKPRTSKKNAAATDDDDDAYAGPATSRAATGTRRRSQRKVNGKDAGVDSEGDATSGTEHSEEHDEPMDDAEDAPAAPVPSVQVNGHKATPPPRASASPIKKRGRPADEDDEEDLGAVDATDDLSTFKSR
ncbi:hypothetical protein EXIGLDRAFT_833952, partial [Exidia glandulosa HHB12029]